MANERLYLLPQQRPRSPVPKLGRHLAKSDLGLHQQAADIDDLLRHGSKTDFVAMEARAVAARANMEAAIAVVLAAR